MIKEPKMPPSQNTKFLEAFEHKTKRQIYQSLEILNKELHKRLGLAFDVKAFCHPKQFAAISDTSLYATMLTTRRAGKTVGCGADLINTALVNPGSTCIYITKTRVNAKVIFWPILKMINQKFNLGGEPDETMLSMKFPRDSIIYCSGVKDKSEIEKFRGMAIKKVYIDEAQKIRSYIGELIDDVLAPACIDYNGQIRVMGTPGPIPAGYFFDVCHSDFWAHHSFSIFDNPHIKDPKTRLEIELKRRGITIDHPSIQREWFGKWALDSDALLLHYDSYRNHYDVLPKVNFNYILGVDLGFEDADALAVIGWSSQLPVAFLVFEKIVVHQGITELIAQIQALRSKYDISKIVMDTGGLGKKIAEELIKRHQIPILPADKKRKMEFLSLMDDALRTGTFKAPKSSRFAQECVLLERDDDKSDAERIVLTDSSHSDIVDAVLYAWKEAYAYTHQPEPVVAKYGTPEWAKEEAERMEEAAEEYFKKQEDFESWM